MTVISPLQRLTIQGVAKNQGHVLVAGDERKRATHSSACHSAGILFVSVLVNSQGTGAMRQLRPSKPWSPPSPEVGTAFIGNHHSHIPTISY